MTSWLTAARRQLKNLTRTFPFSIKESKMRSLSTTISKSGCPNPRNTGPHPSEADLIKSKRNSKMSNRRCFTKPVSMIWCRIGKTMITVLIPLISSPRNLRQTITDKTASRWSSRSRRIAKSILKRISTRTTITITTSAANPTRPL